MNIRITGTNFDMGEALRSRIDDHMTMIVEKYFDGGFSGHVNISLQGKGFRTECRVNLDSGVDLGASASDNDANRCFDMASEKIEKRLRRYKRRLKDHRAKDNQVDLPALDYVLDAGDEQEESHEEQVPLIIAETQTRLRTMTVSMAMMDLDLREATVVMFKNASHGRLNIVYRRPDGNIGWIDPLED